MIYNPLMQTNIEITRAFMETPDGVLSIHQISRKLKLPYGTAYNRIHILNEQGIVQMLPQGKAKLCALNPENPMTASLLALGSAQKTDLFVRQNPSAGVLLKKIRTTIRQNSPDSVLTTILLTPDILKIFAPEASDNDNIQSDALLKLDLSLDFFFICSDPSFDGSEIENHLSRLIPPGISARITNMTLDRNTLLGMFAENENEAGLAAYTMLHEGLILFGFENFYTLILEAFARKLAG